MEMIVRLVGVMLVAMGVFTLYFAHKHGRLEVWSIIGGACYMAAGVSGAVFASWWPILVGVLLAAGIGGMGGVARDRR